MLEVGGLDAVVQHKLKQAYCEVSRIKKWQHQHGLDGWGNPDNWLLGLASLMDDETRREVHDAEKYTTS